MIRTRHGSFYGTFLEIDPPTRFVVMWRFDTEDLLRSLQ